MATVDFETSIVEFLALGRKLQAALPLTGKRVLDELTAWYGQTRIKGASLEDDGDMLLLQWGETQMLKITQPSDLRYVGDDDIEFWDYGVKYLDFTRQVFAVGDDESDGEESEDSAVQMRITLGFDDASGKIRGSNLWISTPSEIETGVQDFTQRAFVRALLTAPPRLVSISVDNCG